MPRLFPARGFAGPVKDAPRSLFETKAVAVQMPAPAFWLDGNPYRSDLADPDTIGVAGAFAASALVYRCMMFRATKLAEAPLWIREENDGDETWLPGTEPHPLAALFEQPNPDQPAQDFVAQLSLYMDLGDTLIALNRDRGGRVASMYLFAYDQFTVGPATVDGIPRLYGKFTVTDVNGRQTPIAPENAIYLPTLGGTSAVAAALSHVRISDAMRQAIRSALSKSMRPSAVLTIPAVADDSALARLKMTLAALYAGADRMGSVAVFEQDAKYQQLVASLKDLELGPVQGDVEVAVCQAFGLRPEVVGAKIALENNGGLSDSIPTAVAMAYDQAIIPAWTRIETRLTAALLRPVDPNPVRFVRFVRDDIRALQPDMQANATIAKTLDGIATRNERRAIVALPPLDGPEGDELTATPAPPTPAPETPKARPGALESKALNTDAERAAFWEAKRAKAAPSEERYAATARRLFREERAGVLATLRAAVPKSARAEWETKDDPGATAGSAEDRLRAIWEAPYLEAAELAILADFAADGVYAQAWAEEFQQLLRATMEGAAKDFVSGVGVTFNMDDPALLAAIRERAAALVQHVTETTKRAITEAIATGKAEGLTIEQIAARIESQAFGAIAKQRAQTIANTEVVGAINEAEWTAAQKAGVFRSKRWIHSRGAEGRTHHIGYEGEGPNGGWVPMTYTYVGAKGATFGRPHEPGMPASEVVNCDCVLAYSDVDPAQAQEENA